MFSGIVDKIRHLHTAYRTSLNILGTAPKNLIRKKIKSSFELNNSGNNSSDSILMTHKCMHIEEWVCRNVLSFCVFFYRAIRGSYGKLNFRVAFPRFFFRVSVLTKPFWKVVIIFRQSKHLNILTIKLRSTFSIQNTSIILFCTIFSFPIKSNT